MPLNLLPAAFVVSRLLVRETVIRSCYELTFVNCKRYKIFTFVL